MSLQEKPREKKTRRKKSSSLLLYSSTPSFSLLPDDITINYLARIPRSYYTTLSTVSKSFKSLLSSTDLYINRSHLRNTEQCLYVCLKDPSYQFPQWFTLSVNPNQTLPNLSMITKKKKGGQLLVPVPLSDFASLSQSTVVVGSEIYVIGGPVLGAPSSTVRILDCRSHTWRDAPTMNVARENAPSCLYDGKIYVTGGCKGLKDDEPWAEVFDTMTQMWERLPDPDTDRPRLYVYGMKESEGKIYVSTAKKMYAYDPKQNKWEGNENISDELFKSSEYVIENVAYSFCDSWSWSLKNYRNVVKGLKSLKEKYKRNGGSMCYHTSKFVNCGGKLLVIWEEYMQHNPKYKKKIWCAQIELKEHDGVEVWENVEWVDLVLTVPTYSRLLHSLVVSV